MTKLIRWTLAEDATERRIFDLPPTLLKYSSIVRTRKIPSDLSYCFDLVNEKSFRTSTYKVQSIVEIRKCLLSTHSG